MGVEQTKSWFRVFLIRVVPACRPTFSPRPAYAFVGVEGRRHQSGPAAGLPTETAMVSANWREVLLRVAKEFWFPAITAASWTAYATWGGPWSPKVEVSVFAPAFFLVSWATGQLFRIGKQSAVDRNLRMIEERLVGLLGRIESSTTELIAHMTGGDSFCRVRFTDPDESGLKFMAFAVHHGKYTMREVDVRILDIDKINASAPRDLSGHFLLSRGTLVPGYQVGCLAFAMGNGSRVLAHISVQALNGATEQRTLLRCIGGKWLEATLVLREYKAIYRHIDSEFPLDDLKTDGWWEHYLIETDPYQGASPYRGLQEGQRA